MAVLELRPVVDWFYLLVPWYEFQCLCLLSPGYPVLLLYPGLRGWLPHTHRSDSGNVVLIPEIIKDVLLNFDVTIKLANKGKMCF